MKTRILSGLLAAITAGLPLAAVAAESSESTQVAAPVYQPPMRGAPASRIGGGARGTRDENLVLCVLAPEHTGLTTRAQPTLYWFVSEPVPSQVEVTVLAPDAEKPVLSRTLPGSTGIGVHALDLSRLGVTLKPGVEYEWFVSVVRDPQQRSRDVTAGGTIERVTLEAATKAQASAAGDRGSPMVYAQAGLWYDAIDSLSRLIDRHPGDEPLRSQRAALLEQVNLPAAAAYDWKAGGR
jgi:hypothetical protein